MEPTPTETKQQIETLRRSLLQREVNSSVRLHDELKLQYLAEKGYPEAVSALTSVLSALKYSPDFHDVWVRRYVTQSLGSCGQVSAFGGLHRALEDPDPDVRIDAITGATVAATSPHKEAAYRAVARVEAWNLVEKAKRDTNLDVQQRAFECMQALMEDRD